VYKDVCTFLILRYGDLLGCSNIKNQECKIYFATGYDSKRKIFKIIVEEIILIGILLLAFGVTMESVRFYSKYYYFIDKFGS